MDTIQTPHSNTLTVYLVIKHFVKLAQLAIKGEHGELLAVSMALFGVYQDVEPVTCWFRGYRLVDLFDMGHFFFMQRFPQFEGLSVDKVTSIRMENPSDSTNTFE